MQSEDMTSHSKAVARSSQYLIGKNYGRLTVIDFSHKNNNSIIYWVCNCTCGGKTTVDTASLNRGTSQSCGCLRQERALLKNSRHNLSKTSIHNVWNGIIQRCTNVNDKYYKRYGGRGIVVCDSWLTFENFYRDMGDKPKGMSIDRIDNNKGYSNDNCKWSTPKEQCNNRRSNLNITYQGKTQTLTQWANELGINKGTLRDRIVVLKWTMERAFNPKDMRFKNEK